jgi:predicted DNA-binding protein YlxM (UPF0122 family)
MPAKKVAKAPAKRLNTDWEAVERDYRTDKYTLRELAEKYKISHQAIAKMAKKYAWIKDLAKAIKQATNAKLVQDLVDNEVAKGGQEVANTVLAAAELNKQVILKHRQDIEATRKVAAELLQELQETKLLAEEKELLTQILAGSGASPSDESQARMLVKRALDVGSRVSSVKTLAETFTKLQTSERIAFSLDSEGKKQDEEISDDAIDARLKDLLSYASANA